MVSGRFLPRLAACRCANRPNSTSLVLDGSRVRPNFPSRLHKASWTRRASSRYWKHSTKSSIYLTRRASPRKRLDHTLEPQVEHVMQIYVAQHDADRTALRCSLLVRMNLAILQDACLQPAPGPPRIHR